MLEKRIVITCTDNKHSSCACAAQAWLIPDDLTSACAFPDPAPVRLLITRHYSWQQRPMHATKAAMEVTTIVYLAVILALLVLILVVCLWLLGTVYLYLVHKRFAHIPRPKMARYDVD